MNTSKIYMSFFIAGMILCASCTDFPWNCIKGNDRIVTVRRLVGDFTNVASYGDFIVDVTIGPTASVSVEADENLLAYIETYIQGNTLILETTDNHCIKSRRQIFVHIVTPSVHELKMSGSGVIYCDDIVSDEIIYVLEGSGDIQSSSISAGLVEAKITGSGEITLEGTALQTDFLISGSGSIKSLNLEHNNCIATITGSGTIYIFANNLLDVLISGSGNVVYKGNPEKVVKITGSGRVIKY